MTVDLVVLNDPRPLPAGAARADHGGDVRVERLGDGPARRRVRPPRRPARRDALLMLQATARLHVRCDGRSLGRMARPAAPAGRRAAATAPGDLGRRGAGAAPPPRARDAGGTRPGRRRCARRRRPAAGRTPPPRRPGNAAGSPSAEAGAEARLPPPLLLDNGIGGLTPAGDYQMRVRGDHLPPAPWANVIANPRGGFVVTERGAASPGRRTATSSGSRPGTTTRSATRRRGALPARRGDRRAVERHAGAGRPGRSPTPSATAPGVSSSSASAAASPPPDAGMAATRRSSSRCCASRTAATRPRRIAVTAYVEWTLGVTREHTQHQVRTELRPGARRDPRREHFDPQFAGLGGVLRAERAGDSATRRPARVPRPQRERRRPRRLRSAPLAGTTGAGLDPCAALQCVLELAPGETRELVVLLGAAEGERRGAPRHRPLPRRAARAARPPPRSVERRGRSGSRSSVRTPEPAFDAMLNRWTLYQALACRMWARSALYQSSGAYGFRDQLQDVMAFVYAEPALAREHILRAAARQFVEGDVQHWWHPQSGRGVRTRFSDDLAWLPYVVDHYVRVTGDASACSTSTCRSSRCARSSRTSTRSTTCPASPTSTPASTSTACARCAGPARPARTACRSSASATGTTA
jgi:cyclic beta-1,2-glucan synthetase